MVDGEHWRIGPTVDREAFIRRRRIIIGNEI
jgi:hypothetical protein